MKDTVILIPAYQPTESLLHVIQSVLPSGFHIVVVDDGSGDAFLPIFEEASKYATVLHQNPNQGKGAALKKGIAYVRNTLPECQYIVTADADGQHTAPDIIKISDKLHENGGFVIGARKFDNKVPFRSRYGNAITRLVFLVAAGKKCSDTQTGLRGFSRDLFDFMVNVKGNRYEYEMNVLMQTAQGGIAIQEVPIATVYENNNETSHFNTFHDSFRVYKTIFMNSFLIKYGLSAVFCFLIDFGALSVFELFIPFAWLYTLMARCISSPINYVINRVFVFRSNANKASSFISYILLAACVIVVKMGLMTVLVDVLGVHYAISDISVEVVLFISNFIIQKLFIFKNKKKN